jgi:hypothetical protein
MTDFMPEPEFVEVSDRIWGAIGKYLPHKDGKPHVGYTRYGLNPERAKEEIYDALKKAKKASGKRHLDPLMKRGFQDRFVNSAIHDLTGGVTLVKGKRGRAYGKAYVVRGLFASKLGWMRRKIVYRFDLPKLRGKLRRRMRRRQRIKR